MLLLKTKNEYIINFKEGDNVNSEYYKNEILKTAAEGKKLSTKAKI